MPDLFDLFSRWWKQILLVVILSVIITAAVVFIIPQKYLSTSTALPAPPYASDKSAVFSQNLQSLYSAIGTTDDLDMILGTARLDTVYWAVADQLRLADYFGIEKNDAEASRKAGSILKKRTRVIKTDYGELRVKVWDYDKAHAADMANAIMEKLQEIHQAVKTANNASMLSRIREVYAEKKLDYQRIVDSVQHTTGAADADLYNSQKISLLQQIQEYEKLLNQYQLMVDAKPQALIIIERAVPALKPDRPRPVETILAAAVLSLFFALLAALVLERRMMKK